MKDYNQFIREGIMKRVFCFVVALALMLGMACAEGNDSRAPEGSGMENGRRD